VKRERQRGAAGDRAAMSTTRVLAGDLSASLSFFLAGELILAFQNVLSLTEIVVCAIALVFASTALSNHLKSLTDLMRAYPLLTNVSELLDTVAFLSTTTVVQLSITLIRQTVYAPAARVITVVSALLLMRAVLTSVQLGKRFEHTE